MENGHTDIEAESAGGPAENPAGDALPASPEALLPASQPYPVIGLGASAGGLKALSSFFESVPEKSGMAYIVVVHQMPKEPSMLPDLLQKSAAIAVKRVEDDELIKPDQVYVVPPGKELRVFHGRLQLLDPLDISVPLPINVFFRSLAKDQGPFAAAIVLSGSGTDGALGIREIKANGGLVLAQSEESAEYDGMPRSACNTGTVDLVLPPDQMPDRLVQYFTHMDFNQNRPAEEKDETEKDQRNWLGKVFEILRGQLGCDFSAYKVNTIQRRVYRRMGLNRIDRPELYLRFLRENRDEVDALFRDMLIGVTSFFRDPDSFDSLKEKCLPDLIKDLPEDAVFRAWIPGCSTGEEVYSIAIVLREYLDTVSKRISFQLFGTDIDDVAIAKAREGLFPASITMDVGEQRLKRFFAKENSSYRICRDIRDSVIFSVQDVLRDPPFSRLNLLCCRNLLIYFNGEAQQKLVPLFHYTLRPGGLLMLGNSETIGGFGRLFTPLDKKWKIFRRVEIPQTLLNQVHFPSGQSVHPTSSKPAPARPKPSIQDIGQLARDAILEQYSPPALLVDAEGEIEYILGRVGDYLEQPSGPPSNNVLDQTREGLRLELSSALRTARSTGEAVQRPRVKVRTSDGEQTIDLIVAPQRDPNRLAGRFLVVFKLVDDSPEAPGTAETENQGALWGTGQIATLQKEIQFNRENHQTVVEELESSNEELKSTNEELQSSNEELQSTNEEMESSKEELQSLNEEMQTVNAELQSKVEELSQSKDDIRNLLNSTEIATIFVDNDFCVRRFTSEASDIVNLISTDIGRPLKHVVSNLTYDGMINDLKQVLDKLQSITTEVQTESGAWYTMRIFPYRTGDNRIDGAVLTFSNIDYQKQAQETLETSLNEINTARELVRNVFDMESHPMLVLDEANSIVIANPAFAELVALELEDIERKPLFELKDKLFQQGEFQKQLFDATQSLDSIAVDRVLVESEGKQVAFEVIGRTIREDSGAPYRILLRFNKQP